VDVTVAAVSVSSREIANYGMLSVDKHGVVTDFKEKPKTHKSNLASMGIYIFKWATLKKYLIADRGSKSSRNDFGGDIIPSMLMSGRKISAYRFRDYWRDAGTVERLWESNMDLLSELRPFRIQSKNWDILTERQTKSSCYKSAQASVRNSITSGTYTIHGNVSRTVLSDAVIIREGAQVSDSVIMPNVYIGKNAKIHKAIIGPNSIITDETKIGVEDQTGYYVDNSTYANGISLIEPRSRVSNNKILYPPHV